MARVQFLARVGRRVLQIAQKPRSEQKQGDERQRGRQPRGGEQPRHAENGSHAAGRAHARAACGGVRGGHPVEHVLLGEGETKERTRHPRQTAPRPSRAERRAASPPAAIPRNRRGTGRRWLEKGVEHAEGEGGPQIQPNALQKQRKQRGQRQRAQQIVQQLQPRRPERPRRKRKGRSCQSPRVQRSRRLR